MSLEIRTPRLRMRRWRAEDLLPFARMNADSRVMEFFPSTLTADKTAAMIQVIESRIAEHGFSFLATELVATGEFIGFIGLNIPGHPLPFSPCVEIGWRLAVEHWGKGYAQEGARACLTHGFETLGLSEIVSFTAVGNLRSRHVMERIGMDRDPQGDFDHPAVPDGNPLKRHVIYRKRRPGGSP